jgi:hypothetical protein
MENCEFWINIPDEQHCLKRISGKKLIIVKSQVADLGIEVDVLYVDGERGSHPVAGGGPCRALACNLTNQQFYLQHRRKVLLLLSRLQPLQQTIQVCSGRD